MNSYASFCSGDCTGSAEIVIRDHDGVVLVAAARWLDDVPDALTAEALATKEGLELAAELGYQRVILESDCQSLRSLLRDPSSRRSVIGGPCFDITELGREFDEFRVEWVCRGAKSVAHVCATRATALDRISFWVESVPEWLRDLAVRDLAAKDCNPASDQ